MNNIKWDKNIISINGMSTSLDHDVLEAKEVNGFVLIVTTPQNGNNNNLFGISINTGQMWRIQSVTEIYPNFIQTPYVGISVIEDRSIVATDFYGHRFVINPYDGSIVEKTSSIK